MERRELQIKALADETRLKIIKLLLRHNLCVKALAQKLEITEAAVSQHLGVLFKAQLLTKEKRGYYMHYDVDKNELAKLSDYFIELLVTQKEICEKKECHSGNCSCKKP